MKSIRVKVRTLLIITLLGLMGIVFSEPIFYGVLDKMDDHKFLGEDLEYWKLEPDTLYGESKRLELILEKHDYEIFNLIIISDGMMTSSARVRLQDAETVYSVYESFKDQAMEEEKYDYIMNVALIQWFAGNTEAAEELMAVIPVTRLKAEIKDQYHLIQAGMALTFHELDQVVSHLDQVSETYYDLAQTMRRYLSQVYKYDVAYDEAVRDVRDQPMTRYFDELVYGMNQYPDAGWNEIYGQAITISGRVTLEGQPVAGAMVYAKSYDGMSSYEGYSKFMAVTDSEGRYVIESKDGMKGLGIKIPWQIFQRSRLERYWHYDYSKDTVVDFDFEKGIYFKEAEIVDGNFVYEIGGHNEDIEDFILTISNADPDYINDQTYFTLTEAKGSVPLEDIQREARFRFGWMGSDDVFDIKMLTEPLYLTGDYYFSVDQVRKDYQYATNGFFTDALKTIIHYEGTAYNQGDRLIMEDKVDEALAWYAEHPTRHNLKVLAAVYSKGTRAEDGEYDQRLYGADLDKAIYYTQALIEMDGATQNRLLELIYLYQRQDSYEEEKQVLDQLVALDDSPYVHSLMGDNAIMRGDYFEGLAIYLSETDMFHYGDRYYAYFILGDQLSDLPKEIKEPLMAKDRSDFEIFFQEIQAGNYEGAYHDLMTLADTPLRTFYMLMFYDAFEFDFMDYPFETDPEGMYFKVGFMDYYVETTHGVKDNRLKGVLKFIKEENNWF